MQIIKCMPSKSTRKYYKYAFSVLYWEVGKYFKSVCLVHNFISVFFLVFFIRKEPDKDKFFLCVSLQQHALMNCANKIRNSQVG